MAMPSLLRWLELQNRVLSMNKRNIDYIYAHNPRCHHLLANDKCLTKEHLTALDVPVPLTYAIIEYMGDIDATWNALATYPTLVIKPASGSGGGGILVLQTRGDTWVDPSGEEFDRRRIRQHISDIIFGNYSLGLSDKALIEERVVQADFLNAICPYGVADIRVIVLEGRPIMAMSRIPTRASHGKANLHQGALGVAVDLATGTLGHGLGKRGYTRTHPDTAVAFTGLVIPGWSTILGMCEKIGRHTPLGYLGIDVVLDSVRGPVVMEINLRPGLEIQNVNRCGLSEALAEAGCR